VAWWRCISWWGVVWLILPGYVNAILLMPSVMKNYYGDCRLPPPSWDEWLVPGLWTAFVIAAGFAVGYYSAEKTTRECREREEPR